LTGFNRFEAVSVGSRMLEVTSNFISTCPYWSLLYGALVAVCVFMWHLDRVAAAQRIDSYIDL